LRTAQRDVQALTALIDDLFDLAQFDAGQLMLDRHPTSVADLVSNTIERYAELAARHQVALAGDAGPDIIADLDAQKVERVLANLVGNALRHTPGGGRVQVRAAAAAGQVEIEVIDTGEGIGAEDLPHIFDQFYRGEKSRSRTTGGAGLGLAIARRIVEAHGGRIWAESRTGEGARFVVRLPAGTPS
jgi:signal transduction histidine kinase